MLWFLIRYDSDNDDLLPVASLRVKRDAEKELIVAEEITRETDVENANNAILETLPEDLKVDMKEKEEDERAQGNLFKMCNVFSW